MRKLLVVFLVLISVSLFAGMVPGQEVTINIYQNQLHTTGWIPGEHIPDYIYLRLEKIGYTKDRIKYEHDKLYQMEMKGVIFIVIVGTLHAGDFIGDLDKGLFIQHEKTITFKYLFTDERMNMVYFSY